MYLKLAWWTCCTSLRYDPTEQCLFQAAQTSVAKHYKKHPCQSAFGHFLLQFPSSRRFSFREACLHSQCSHFLPSSRRIETIILLRRKNPHRKSLVYHVNTVTWSAISTGSTLAHFGEMIWFLTRTAHLTKRRTFGALLDVTSSAVFTTLQRIFFRLRYGMSWTFAASFRWRFRFSSLV